MSTRRRAARGMVGIRWSRSREKVCRRAVYKFHQNTHYCSTYSSAHTSKHPLTQPRLVSPQPTPISSEPLHLPLSVSLTILKTHASYSNSSSQPSPLSQRPPAFSSSTIFFFISLSSLPAMRHGNLIAPVDTPNFCVRGGAAASDDPPASPLLLWRELRAFS